MPRHGKESPQISYDFDDAMLTTGLLDIHMHGALLGRDAMDVTRDSLGAIGSFLRVMA
ncbi:MAG: hypothetical protein JO266_16220 [Acidobacteria bacterium]|nr:hypothetical protein [Acidobacteriota bacterium]